MTIRTQLNAGALLGNHSEVLRRDSDRPAISMRQQIRTTGRKEDRLELLVVRAGVRAGKRMRDFGLAARRGRW